MAKTLTVILGAGAATDIIPPASGSAVRELRLKPPLTKDLFFTDPVFEEIFSSFPGVEQLLGTLRSIKDPENSAKSLEQFLKRLKSAPEEYKRKQFRDFPPYLQHYFGRVSWEYCHHPTNYNSLLNETLRDNVTKVSYVTLNYDLLFDRALEKHRGINFRTEDVDMNKYIHKNQKWMYIKLHGSVDWGRKIKGGFVKNPGINLPSLLDNVHQLGDNLDNSLEDDIVIDLSYKTLDRQPVYPAISVPVDGESKFNCPDQHLVSLKDHLDKCNDFLVIGFSGVDKDLLELLNNKNGGFRKVLLVCGSEEGGSRARDNFMNYHGLGEKLQMNLEVYRGGFSDFLASSTLDAFLL